MKRFRLLAFLAGLVVLGGCGLNQQNLDLLQGQTFEVMERWPIDVPKIVERTDLHLDGRLPDDTGLRLGGAPPSTLITPSSIRVVGEGHVGLAAGCIERLEGTVELRLYLGPEGAVWEHPLGDPFAIDLAQATTGFAIDTTLDPEQKKAVLAGAAFVGATVTGDVHVTFDRDDRCVGPDGYIHAEILMKLVLRSLEIVVQIF